MCWAVSGSGPRTAVATSDVVQEVSVWVREAEPSPKTVAWSVLDCALAEEEDVAKVVIVEKFDSSVALYGTLSDGRGLTMYPATH